MKQLLGPLVLFAAVLASAEARAWDPSTTHVAMARQAALDSELHRRWMDQTGQQRGLFSGLRIDPKDVDKDRRRLITVALRRTHAASGTRGLGGPGACPGPSAPPATRRRCVQGDLWEMTALGWIQLGIIVESSPRERLLHHFVDRKDPGALRWSDAELPRVVLRLKHRRSGAPLASSANRTAFAGDAPSAMAWLTDKSDPWAPPAMLEHRRKAALASTAAERQHHLALALLGVGALLHVVQDLSVPAHARADVTAFFAPLSNLPGDRGLPVQEFARVTYGRTALPGPVSLRPRPSADKTGAAAANEAPSDAGRAVARATPLAWDLRGHLLGSNGWEGLTHFTGRRFLSESSVPAPTRLDPALSAGAAAAKLLDGVELADVEKRGATLRPWPADAGYLVNREGRGIAAYDTDDEGLIRVYLDRRIYRSQAAHLIPKGIEVSASILDLLFPAFPDASYTAGPNILSIDLRDGPQAPAITAFFEDNLGRRTSVRKAALRRGERNRIVGLLPRAIPKNTRLVLVLEGKTAAGFPFIAEHAFDIPAGGTKDPDRTVRTPARPVKPKPLPAGATPSTPSASPEIEPDLRDPFPSGGEPKRPAPEPEPEPEPEPDQPPKNTDPDPDAAPLEDPSSKPAKPAPKRE